MKLFKRLVFLVAVLAYLPFTASAWGMIGHRVVGEVADFYLKAKTRKAIKRVLGTESIGMASNWADFIKSDTSFKYMDSWHYVNLPEGLDRAGVSGFLDSFQEANVYSKIPEMVAILKDKSASPQAQQQAMRILIHLVGDLHQPMHTARKHDLGGNKVQVTWFGQRSNLHRVWDEQIIGYQQLSYTEFADVINHPTKEQFKAWSHDSLKDVVFQSYEVCNEIYTAIPADGKLGYEYNFKFGEVVNQQLLKGGIRLAAILNQIYG